jgi:hypothetical protein
MPVTPLPSRSPRPAPIPELLAPLAASIFFAARSFAKLVGSS